MLGIIRKHVDKKTAAIIMPLYTYMMQPHLEPFVLFWSPFLRNRNPRTGKAPEKKATNIFKENLPYEDRLKPARCGVGCGET